MYHIRTDNYIIRDSDGACIPPDPLNSDYIEYQAWVAAGNTAPLYDALQALAANDPRAAWAVYQGLALSALNDSDTTVLRCFERSVQVPLEWVNYRAALRAILSMKDGDATNLPARPAYPAGT